MRLQPLATLASLKEATRDAHHRLDQSSCMSELLLPELTLQRYGEILQVLHQIYAFIEPQLVRAESSLGAVCLWDAKTAWLAQDLQALEISGGSLISDLLPQEWTICSQAELAGCMYVMEGSSLGGQVIVRKLQTALGQQANHALRFFEGYGQATYERWGGTCQGIDACLKTPDALHQAIQKAQSVFELFIHSLAAVDGASATTTPLATQTRHALAQ